jgi:dipeptidase D
MKKLSEQLQKLTPKAVFSYFCEISAIPRQSGKEDKIVAWLTDFAKQHSLKYVSDGAGNILIRKPATPGMENRKTAVLQSHVDMVAEKNSDVNHDFDSDPIIPMVDGDRIRACGTTLGADCGIGMAAALATLADTTLRHGPLECLFTVDEERGLTGARALRPDFITGKILLNLDSEDDGELFTGCAGGLETTIKMGYANEPVPTDYIAFKLSVKGLRGGHSGDDINKNRPNAIKLLNRFLWRMSKKYDYRMSAYEGGDKHNAIPREAFAIFTVNAAEKEQLYKNFNIFKTDLENEYKSVEKNLAVELVETAMPQHVIDELTQYELFALLQVCPSGVLWMSNDIEGLVETSINLASIRLKNREIKVVTSIRSSIESKKYDIADMILAVTSLTNGRVEISEGYPGWQPNPDSEILNITKTAYKRLFGEEPKVKAIHAGLECGLFAGKYPGLDMVSFGPTIRNPHSPDEYLETATVERFWQLLKCVLENVPENS